MTRGNRWKKRYFRRLDSAETFQILRLLDENCHSVELHGRYKWEKRIGWVVIWKEQE